MSPQMTEYFRRKLLKWRSELLQESEETLQSLQEGGLQEADIADRASLETDRSLELRTRDRERKLISKIDAALMRIEDGTYGYCEETGDPISIRRLEARPIATLSLEAQELHERRDVLEHADHPQREHACRGAEREQPETVRFVTEGRRERSALLLSGRTEGSSRKYHHCSALSRKDLSNKPAA